MEKYCSTGQSPQRAVVPTEEEEIILYYIILHYITLHYIILYYIILYYIILYYNNINYIIIQFQ